MRLTPLLRVYWNIPKGPKQPLYRPFKYFNLATPEKYGGVGKPSAYLKNMLHDAPELFVCICLALSSYVALFGFYKYEQKHGIYRGTPYKQELIVIR